MSTKLLYNTYEIHLFREVRRASKDKSITDIHKLKERLSRQNIKVSFEIKNGKVQNISFEKESFKVTSVKGNDRVFTDRVLKSVDSNHKEQMTSKNKEQSQEKGNDRFDKIRATREQKTAIEKQSMYSNKGLSR